MLRNILTLQLTRGLKTAAIFALTLTLILGQPAAALTTEGSPTTDGDASSPSAVTTVSETSMTATTDSDEPSQTAELEATIDNSTTTESKSGDAEVNTNTTGGDATSGDSTGVSTTINQVESSWTAADGATNQTFVKNVDGSKGDIMIDPNNLETNTPTSQHHEPIYNAAKLTINNSTTVSSESGDATVRQNTTAGDALTGQAQAVANVINSLGSTVTSGSSFVGVINIAGDYVGDVLLPKDIADNLYVASSSVTDLATNTLASITNNLLASAASGNADVVNNTTAGDATTGDADTSVSVLNVASQVVNAERVLLVFVNVLGTWTGKVLTGNVQSTPNTSDSSLGGESNLEASINNNISVSARSGDAVVRTNTTAGDATSGDAGAHINLLNLVHASFQVSDWFGILFINVLGDWDGDVAIAKDKTTTKPTKPVADKAASRQPKSTGIEAVSAGLPQPMALVASAPLSGVPSGILGAFSSDSTDDESDDAANLTSAASSAFAPQAEQIASLRPDRTKTANPILDIAGFLSLAAAYVGGRMLFRDFGEEI